MNENKRQPVLTGVYKLTRFLLTDGWPHDFLQMDGPMILCPMILHLICRLQGSSDRSGHIHAENAAILMMQLSLFANELVPTHVFTQFHCVRFQVHGTI
jgi:hypothetical protein